MKIRQLFPDISICLKLHKQGNWALWLNFQLKEIKLVEIGPYTRKSDLGGSESPLKFQVKEEKFLKSVLIQGNKALIKNAQIIMFKWTY